MKERIALLHMLWIRELLLLCHIDSMAFCILVSAVCAYIQHMYKLIVAYIAFIAD